MITSQSTARLSRSTLVYGREQTLHGVILLVSLAIYAVLVLAALAKPQTGLSIVLYAVMIALVSTLAHGLALGRLRGNGVRVSRTQLPLVHRLVQDHSRKLGMAQAPDVYVVQAGGVLNAFATRFFGRDFVVLYSDVLDLALEQGEAAVSFIVAHELGHVWRGHLKRRWLTAPGRAVPYLGAAYSRAREYTCDRVGAFCAGSGAIEGLLVLAAGKQLYRHVDARGFAQQAADDTGFWIRRAELMSTHPRLPKRVGALMDLGVAAPTGQVAEAAGTAA